MRAFDHAPTELRRFLILGGGFGGIYAALELEKVLARHFACLTDGQAARRPAAVPTAAGGAGVAS